MKNRSAEEQDELDALYDAAYRFKEDYFEAEEAKIDRPKYYADLYNTVLGKLRDAVDDMRPTGPKHNAYAALKPTLDMLDRALEDHADDQKLMLSDMKAAMIEAGKLIESGAIPNDIEVMTFMRRMDENVLDTTSILLGTTP